MINTDITVVDFMLYLQKKVDVEPSVYDEILLRLQTTMDMIIFNQLEVNYSEGYNQGYDRGYEAGMQQMAMQNRRNDWR